MSIDLRDYKAQLIQLCSEAFSQLQSGQPDQDCAAMLMHLNEK